MKILYFKNLTSTHNYLIENLKNGILEPPIAIVTDHQTKGVGSRGNSWESLEGNLFLSFAIGRSNLPKDIPLSSLSIYFSYIMKLVLEEKKSKVWIKWPNDFYVGDKKVGGVISLLQKDVIVNSIGINLQKAPKSFAILDIKIDKKLLIEEFFSKVELKKSWKYIFSKYSVEFQKSRKYQFNYNQKKISLKNAKLLEDGSISLDGKRIYNLR